MKKFNVFNIFSNKYVKYSLLLIGGVFIGWLLFHHSRKSDKQTGQVIETTKVQSGPVQCTHR